LIFAGRFGFRLTARLFMARFLAAGFVATGFLATGFLATRPLIAVAAMRILAVLRTRMGLLGLLLGLLLALWLDAAEHAAQFIQFAFVHNLLALGNLDEFEDSIKFVSHLLERLGNGGGVLDGLSDGRGLGGTKIGGLDPRLGTRRFRTAFRPIFRPRFAGLFAGLLPLLFAWLLAWRFGLANRLCFRRGSHFRRRFDGGNHGVGFLHGEPGGFFWMRFTEIAGRVTGSFCGFRSLRHLGRRGGRFDGFRRGRHLPGGGRGSIGRGGAWRAAAGAATAMTPPAVARTACCGGRVQI
jgi:hypothetical protein